MKKPKGRNWIAVDTHFRKGGPMKDKKKELPREKKYEEKEDEECQKDTK